MQLDLQTSVQHSYLGVAIFLVILTTFMTFLRFYSRVLKNIPPAADDWFAVAALIFYLAEVGLHLWSMFSGGVGRHIENVSKEEIATAFKSLTAVEYPYTVSLTCIRISILIMMLRIFTHERWFKWAVYANIGLNVCWAIFIFFDASLICQPFAYNWDTSIPGGHCGPKTMHFIVMGIWGIVNDCLIWALPHFVLWRLQLDKKKKLILSGIFTLGIFDIVIEIVRIVQLARLDITGDFTYTLAPVEIWSFVESGVAIVIANLPLCRAIIERFWPSRRPPDMNFSSSYQKKGSSNGTSRSTKSRVLDDDELELAPKKFGVSSFSATTVAESEHKTPHYNLESMPSNEELRTKVISIHQDITVTEDNASNSPV